jgi:predicted GNAT family acetyltransferase
MPYRPLPDDGVPERILTGSLGQRFLSVEGEPEATRPVAVARMTMAPGWAGLHAMWVDPTQRRRGHAHRLAARIGQLATTDGLDWVYLHVESANTVARQCYRRLGFVEDSGYVYYRQSEQR